MSSSPIPSLASLSSSDIQSNQQTSSPMGSLNKILGVQAPAQAPIGATVGNVYSPDAMKAASGIFSGVPQAPAYTPIVSSPVDTTVTPQTNPLPPTSSSSYSNSTGTQNQMNNPYDLGNTDWLGEYMRVQAEQAQDKANGTGLYALPQGLAISPSQMKEYQNTVDNIYGERLGTIGTKASYQLGQLKAGYGTNGALSGVPMGAASAALSMANDFNNSDAVKKFNAVQTSAIQTDTLMKRLESGQVPPTGVDDAKLIMLYAQAANPGSITGQGEFNDFKGFATTLPVSIQSKIGQLVQLNPDGTAKLSTTGPAFLTSDERRALAQTIGDEYRNMLTPLNQQRQDAIRRIEGVTGKAGSADPLLTNFVASNPKTDYTVNSSQPSTPNGTFVQDANGTWHVQR